MRETSRAASRHVEHKSLDRRDGLVLLHRSNIRWIFSWNFWESLAIHRWSPSNRRFNSRLPVRGEQSTFVRSFVRSFDSDEPCQRLTTKYCSLVADLTYSMRVTWSFVLRRLTNVRESFLEKNIYNLKWNV